MEEYLIIDDSLTSHLEQWHSSSLTVDDGNSKLTFQAQPKFSSVLGLAEIEFLYERKCGFGESTRNFIVNLWKEKYGTPDTENLSTYTWKLEPKGITIHFWGRMKPGDFAKALGVKPNQFLTQSSSKSECDYEEKYASVEIVYADSVIHRVLQAQQSVVKKTQELEEEAQKEEAKKETKGII